MSLKTLMRRHGVSPGTAAKILRTARRNIRDGVESKEADRSAIREHIDELRERRDEVLRLARKKRGAGDATK